MVLMECFKCGLSDSRVLLFDAISDKGIVKICENCSEEEGIPVLRKPGYKKEQKVDLSRLRQPRKRRSLVYERLSKMSGIEMKDEPRQNLELVKQEVSLKDIVNQNFKERVKKVHLPKPYLVTNFHWIIMRSRRLKKLTAEQLAVEIGEPELAVKMAEKGVLPEDDKKLIAKIEKRLGVKLVKDEFRMREEPIERLVQGIDFELEDVKVPESIDFKTDETKTLTISDLQEMKRRREEKLLEEEQESFKEEIVFNEDATEDMPEFKMKEEFGGKEKPKRSFTDKHNLTDKEIDDILFGRG